MVVERIGNGRSICISSLSRETVAEAEADHLGGNRGLFIYEMDKGLPGGIQVLAKVVSLEAAFALIDIWRAK